MPYIHRYQVGALPDRLDTIQAAVLAALLDGTELLTQYNAHQLTGTQSLSKEIHRLEKDLGWCIQRVQFTHECSSLGPRYDIISVGYRLSKETLRDARFLYGSTWTDMARAYRDLRKQAAQTLELLKVVKYLADEKPEGLAVFRDALRLAGML